MDERVRLVDEMSDSEERALAELELDVELDRNAALVKAIGDAWKSLEIPYQNPPRSDTDPAESAANHAREPLDREALGRRVREVWLAWARVQTFGGARWLLVWDEMSPEEREVDRLIGETIAREAVDAHRRGARLDADELAVIERARALVREREAASAVFAEVGVREGSIGDRAAEIVEKLEEQRREVERVTRERDELRERVSFWTGQFTLAWQARDSMDRSRIDAIHARSVALAKVAKLEEQVKASTDLLSALRAIDPQTLPEHVAKLLVAWRLGLEQ